jgi:rhomboid protease GluP
VAVLICRIEIDIGARMELKHWLGYTKVPTAIWLLLAVCVGVEFVLVGSDLALWGSMRWRSLAYQYGGFWIGLLGNWRPNYSWQPELMFVSYSFLHSGVMHLIVNMITLVALGSAIIQRIGQPKFLALYLVASAGGAGAFAFLSSASQPMVGASGALFGLAGALAAWEYVDRFAAREKLWPVGRLVAWLITLNLVLWWAMDGRLAWETHLGGFFTGWVTALLIDPRSRSIET